MTFDIETFYRKQISAIANQDDSSVGRVRVPVSFARKLLLENASVIARGSVYYLAIKNLGLGVCEIGIRPKGNVNTFLVESILAEYR